MDFEPEVSVLMPAYNSASYVQEAVNSILTQSLTSLELIIIDDGSTDQTHEILSEMALEDSRIVLRSRENRGVVKTRNELLSMAKAELIAWADSDDISEPNRLQMQAACFAQNPRLVSVGSSLLYVDPKGRPLWVQSFPLRLNKNVHLQSPQTDTPFGASMMRTQAVRQVGGFRGPFHIGEDFDLILRLIEIGEIWNLPDTLYRYRQHAQSITSPIQLGGEWLHYYSLIRELAMERRESGCDRLQRGNQLPKISREEVALPEDVSDPVRHAMWARRAKSSGFFRSALVHAWIAIQRAPFSQIGWRAMAHVLLRQNIAK